MKFDGVRAVGYAGRDGLTLYSRNDRDISDSYSEVAALRIKRRLVVDGELVALDERGRPDLGLLRQRMHLTAPTAKLVGRVPVQYVVFDVLRDGDRALLDLPYGRRRELLDHPAARAARAAGARQLHRHRQRCGAGRGGNSRAWRVWSPSD